MAEPYGVRPAAAVIGMTGPGPRPGAREILPLMLRPAPTTAPTAARAAGLLRYVAAWLLAGAAVALAAVLLADGGGSGHRSAAAAPAAGASAPPVRAVELGVAMRAAGCDVRRVALATTTQAGAAIAPGIYRRPITLDQRQRVVRTGVVVVEYRRGADGRTVARLAGVQRAAPNGTVLAPSATLRDDALTVTTFGRQLRCPSTSPRSFDALQLFRGRYLGSGPAG